MSKLTKDLKTEVSCNSVKKNWCMIDIHTIDRFKKKQNVKAVNYSVCSLILILCHDSRYNKQQAIKSLKRSPTWDTRSHCLHCGLLRQRVTVPAWTNLPRFLSVMLRNYLKYPRLQEIYLQVNRLQSPLRKLRRIYRHYARM